MSSTYQTLTFENAAVNGSYKTLNWDNTIFEVGSERNFTVSQTIYNLDNSYSNLKSTTIQSNIHLQYNDAKGPLVADLPITNWSKSYIIQSSNSDPVTIIPAGTSPTPLITPTSTTNSFIITTPSTQP